MIGIKFFFRTPKLKFPPNPFLQSQPSILALGRWVSIYYPLIDEWFDIIGPPPDEAALVKEHMDMKQISFRMYRKMTGGTGVKRAINCFMGRRLFSVYGEKTLEEKVDKEYTNTDDFFSEGPGGHEDLMPPVIFSGLVKGDDYE